jgi:hypothetical protein
MCKTARVRRGGNQEERRPDAASAAGSSVSLRTYHIQLSGMVKDGENTRMLKLAAEKRRAAMAQSTAASTRLRAVGGRRCARATARAVVRHEGRQPASRRDGKDAAVSGKGADCAMRRQASTSDAANGTAD